MGELIFNTNKAMVAYLIKNGCHVKEIKVGINDTLLFGFDKEETKELAQKWFKNKRQGAN